MNIADEIMNELLNQRQPPTVDRAQKNDVFAVNNDFAKMDSPDFHNVQFGAETPAPQKPKIPPTRGNVPIVDKREMEKLKLQNLNAEGLSLGLGIGELDKPHRVPRESSQQRLPRESSQQIPERQPLVNNFMPQSEKGRNSSAEKVGSDNPFLRNQEELREKREAQERNYRRVLEEQMAEEKRKKERERQQFKEQQQQMFNDVPPTTVPQEPEQVAKKRRDPNAQHVPFEKPASGIHESDLEFMKLQVDELRTKMRKGRINFEEFEMQMRKLEAHYKCKIDEVYP